MSKEIFISYSRRDQEFVTRLANDLNSQVAGVWFDQSTIQLGQDWHEEIMEGIRDCKAFILVLSPDAAESKYVREELNKALELGKTIFPILYRPGEWTDELASLVKEIQTLDLRSGSYTDNFQKLVDGLIAAGAAQTTESRPFLRVPTKTPLNQVLNKVPGWAFAWSLGWLAFWAIVLVILFFLLQSQGNFGSDDVLAFLLILIGGGLGGLSGGLIAGLFTMLALRPNAPSISWKHMSPTIRIWAISGPLGMLVSGLVTSLLLAVGALGIEASQPNCTTNLSDCFGQILGSALGQAIGFILIIGLVFTLLALTTWFLTGMFAGGLAVRHIRRLEPGITRRQAWGVSSGWGCGAILAAVVTFLLLGLLSQAFGL